MMKSIKENRRGAEAQRNTMIYFHAPAALQHHEPRRLCASAVKSF
jgi:hypothetical protein